MRCQADLACPGCQRRVSSAVKDTRGVENGSRIWRRRVCLACGYVYTTYERIAVPQVSETRAETIVAGGEAALRKATKRKAA